MLASLLAFYNYKKEALQLLFSLVTLPISLFLKNLFKTPRPSEYMQTHFAYDSSKYGFPSGHVFFYTVFFGILIYALLKAKRINSGLRYFLISVSILHISLVGASRISLRAHSLIDTLGGYFLGGLFLVITLKASKLWEQIPTKEQLKHSKKPPTRSRRTNL